MNFEDHAESNLIYKTLVGSHIYGTNIETSDYDFEGIFVEPKEVLFGVHNVGEVDFSTNKTSERNKSTDIDYKLYAFKKFVTLCATKSNPNKLELLYVRENHIQFINKWGQMLRDNRGLFVSKQAYGSFMNYAREQKRRMEVKPKGSRLEDYLKYGYVPKFAMHTIRLFMEGIRLLTDGEIKLPLPERRQLLDIRLGKHTKDEILEMFDYWHERGEQARDRSDLPVRPDLKEVNKFMVDFYELWFYGKKELDLSDFKIRLQGMVNEL